MADIKLLHPELRTKSQKLVDLMNEKGIKLTISQTLRTREEQNALYDQGRTKSGNIVTMVKYPYSLHNWGVAFDIAVIIAGKAVWNEKYYKLVGPVGEFLGMEWGGHWKSFADLTHFQLPGLNVDELIKKYGTPENFIKSWTMREKEAEYVTGFEELAKVVYKGKTFSAGILKGKAYVEIRTLAEFLGLKIDFDKETKTVILS